MRLLRKNRFIQVMSVSLLLTGCLKDKNVSEGRFGINIPSDEKVIEIAGPINGRNLINLDAGSTSVKFLIVTVRLASGKPADKDIQVTLNLAPELITSYNNANGTNYDTLPPSIYNFEGGSTVVTIPADSTVGYLNANLIPNNLIGFEYALGFSIGSVSDPSVKISGNYKTQVAVLGVKNKYDGRYTLKGAFYHPSISSGYGKYTTTVELHTTGGNSVNLFWPLLGGYAHPILNGTSFSYFSSQEAGYSIDNATNAVTVSNVSPTATIIYSMGDNYNSRYETNDKTFYVQFGYNHQPGGVFNPAATREWTDTLIYLGPR